MFIRIANHRRAVFAFCFVLESCEHQSGRLEQVSASAEGSNWLRMVQQLVILNILQYILPPRPVYQTLLFDFSWFWFETRWHLTTYLCAINLKVSLLPFKLSTRDLVNVWDPIHVMKHSRVNTSQLFECVDLSPPSSTSRPHDTSFT